MNSVKFVPGRGNPKANVILIGEAPGKEEDFQGKPFVGASGKLLDEALKHVGWSAEDVYITNVVKVRPNDNRSPTLEEVATWLPLLVDEIKRINPVVVITLGATAARAFNGNTRLTKDHGNTEHVVMDHSPFCVACVYHPSYILRGYAKKADWFADFARIKSENGIRL